MYEITIKHTSDPKIVKFEADHTLIAGSVEMDRNSNISEVPLAQELFKLPYVDRIYITANFLAISKTDDISWEEIEQHLKEVIEAQFQKYPKVFAPKEKKEIAIFTKMTMDPKVMKFISNDQILDGVVEAKGVIDAFDIPLAYALYEKFPFIETVVIKENVVALSKNEEVEWHQVMIKVRDFIQKYLQDKLPVSNIAPRKIEEPVKKAVIRKLLRKDSHGKIDTKSLHNLNRNNEN